MLKMEKRRIMTRVFVTGMGAITPIGNDVDTYWQSLTEGKSGAGRITLFEYGDMPYNMACEVKEFDPTEYMPKKVARRAHRSVQFAVAATKQAMADAELTVDESNWNDVGVVIATGGGGINGMEDATRILDEKGWKSVGPFVVPMAMANAVSCQVSIETGARGPVMTSTAACASGHYSIIEGYHFIQRGEADIMIAGGTESVVSLLTATTFGRMGPLSTRTEDPATACRPFSVDRDGFVSGEGGCVLILESEESVARRGVKPLAEVLGGRITGDAYHITAPAPDGEGAARAIRGAIKSAKIDVTDVDVVLAHGTGTVLNDAGEAMALRKALGDHVDDVKITSVKSMIGHSLGAAGAQSAVAAIRALQTGIVPPTINYTPDPEIDVPIVGNTAQEVDAKYAIVNAFGFGGQNVVAVFGKVDSS